MSFTRLPKIAAFGTALSLLAVVLLAQVGDPRIVVSLTVHKQVLIKDEFGNVKVERTPVKLARPGDILVYSLHYTNKGRSEAWRINLTDPIPEGTILLLGSAEGEGTTIRYSIDEGKTFQPPPIKIVVTDEEGRDKEVDAPPEMYTHVLWSIEGPIERRETGKVSFKVKVQ